MICSVCSSTVVSLPCPTICFWATTSTEANNRSRPSVSFLRTRSNTRRTSFSYGAIMSVPALTGYMVSMTSVSEGSTSSCGKRSPNVSIVSPWLQLWTRRSSAVTGV
uniref:Uncharacterized protein n=1 Tax=Cacopsylla melanoneura TaxID=428564 RepID=A0A8D8SY79_9HEMI